MSTDDRNEPPAAQPLPPVFNDVPPQLAECGRFIVFDGSLRVAHLTRLGVFRAFFQQLAKLYSRVSVGSMSVPASRTEILSRLAAAEEGRIVAMHKVEDGYRAAAYDRLRNLSRCPVQSFDPDATGTADVNDLPSNTPLVGKRQSSKDSALCPKRICLNSNANYSATAASAAATAPAAERVLPPLTYAAAWAFVHSDGELIAAGFPTHDKAVVEPLGDGVTPSHLDATHTCDRCRRTYNAHKNDSECVYHYGRLQFARVVGERVRRFACCQELERSQGCTTAPCHVWREDRINHLHAARPFLISPPPEQRGLRLKLSNCGQFSRPATPPPPLLRQVLAMDCEMCYTTLGTEPCRVTVIDACTDSVIIDDLVMPKGRVLDLNSRFSGVTNLDGIEMTPENVRDKLMKIINEDTILVGHSLDSDLKALRLIHPTVIDTSLLFMHPRGLPIRYSLRVLAAKVLGDFIQESESGHSSVEDSQVCVKLLRYALEHGIVSAKAKVLAAAEPTAPTSSHQL